MLKVLLLLLPLPLSLSVKIFNRQGQQVRSSPFIASPKYIGSFKKTPVWQVRRGKENKQKSWKTSLATDENQDIYSCD